MTLQTQGLRTLEQLRAFLESRQLPGFKAARYEAASPSSPRRCTVYGYLLHRMVRVIDAHHRAARIDTADTKIKVWWIRLSGPAKEIIVLHADVGTSVQFRREFRTRLDIERLLSDGFAPTRRYSPMRAWPATSR